MMKVSHLVLTSLAVAVNSTAAIKIFTGEQINYGVNYAVAFTKESACSNFLLAPTTESPCDRPFWVDNVYCKFLTCSGLMHGELTLAQTTSRTAALMTLACTRLIARELVHAQGLRTRNISAIGGILMMLSGTGPVGTE
jgi:hypothetical protein